MNALIVVGKVAGTAALATAALLTGVHATGTSHTASSSTPAADSGQDQKTKKARCATGYPQANDDLKKALKALRDQPKGDDRKKAAAKIRKDVLAGKYGTKTQVGTYRREVQHLRLLAKAPDKLKADLKTAMKQDAGEKRTAAVLKVWKDAAAGKYGDDVAKVAKRAAAKAQACADRRQKHQDKSKSDSSKSDSSKSDSSKSDTSSSTTS